MRIDECAHGPGGEEIFVRFESWKMVECEREPGTERIEKWKIESGKWKVEKLNAQNGVKTGVGIGLC